MIYEQKFIFSRTILDIPLLAFLFSQTISTIISIDQHTSLFGYYGRFNGGLVSLVCYSLLYWAFVSNVDKNEVKKIIYVLLASTLLTSIYAVFEHYGKSFSCLFVTGKFNVSCWVQDVQNRIFGTFGQPNWLAAWLITVIPLASLLFLRNKSKNKIQTFISLCLLSLFLVVLLYTKSRSGVLGFVTSFTIFWSLVLSKRRDLFKHFVTSLILVISISLIIGTPWTKNLNQIFTNKNSTYESVNKVGPALETGGTESGEIRKIVWKGALEVWKNYPLLGSGVETFAFSYNQFRPPEHNLTSEWDYIYNKAHNEYLNIAANSGTLGILSYLGLITFSIISFWKNLKKENNFLSTALMAGFVSLLVSNFFGFSVVAVSLLFFLYPAISYSLHQNKLQGKVPTKLKFIQKLFISSNIFVGILLFNSILKYWYADFLYAKSLNLSRQGKLSQSIDNLNQAIKIAPNEAIYLNELSSLTGNLANLYNEKSQPDEALKAAKLFELSAKKAISLSPRNTNIKRNVAGIYTKISDINQNYLYNANTILIESEKFAPTDPRTKLNLAGSYIRLGDKAKAQQILINAVKLKPNYKEARYALAVLLADQGQKEKAIEQLNYILVNVDPSDKNFKQFIEDIKKQ